MTLPTVEELVEDQETLLAEWAVQDCEDLFHLAKHTLGYDKLTEHPHADICDFLANTGKYAGRLQNKWKLLLVPRGTYKTTIATAYVLYCILRDPDVRVLVDGETFTKSADILRSVKGLIATRSLLRQVHGALETPLSKEAQAFTRQNKLPWNEDTIIVGSRRNFARKEPTVAIGGVDVARTGYHFDVVVGDDYHSEKNVTTKEQIAKVREHIQHMTMILDPQTTMVLTGTRWHEADAYGWIIEELEGLRLTEPGVYRGKLFDIMWYPWRWGAPTPDGGLDPATQTVAGHRYFTPEIWNERTIQPLRQVLTAYQFAAQMENNPFDDAARVFKEAWLKWCHPKDLPREDFLIFTAVDPTSSAEEYSDYAAIVTAGLDPLGNRYLLDVRHGRWSADETVEQMLQVHQRFRPIQIGIESVSGFKLFKKVVDEICLRKKVRLPVKELPRDTRVSKGNRIRSLGPIFESGAFFVVKGATGVEDFLHEYRRYPRVKHEDILDALADIEEMSWAPAEAGGGLEEAYAPLDDGTGY